MSTDVIYSPFSHYIQEDIKYINIKEQTEESFADCENTEALLTYLKETFKVSDNRTVYRIQASDAVLKVLEKYLLLFTQCNSFTTSTSEDTANVVEELFRSLRNCATNQQTQNFISENTNILQIVKNYIETSEIQQLCMKIILQFLINLMSSNKTVTKKLHDEFLYFIDNTFTKREICIYECSAFIYNLSLVMPLTKCLVDVMFKLHIHDNPNEFILFFIEKCISSCKFWAVYKHLEGSNKLVVLKTLREQQIQNKQCNIHVKGLTTLVNCFLKCPDIIFGLSKTAQDDVHLVSLVLEIISSFSSKDEYVVKLQENKDILVTAAALLITFHERGKDGSNVFTPIQRLSESQEKEAAVNPVFGIKADLIQLIGNLCWKNTSMQNLAREAEVIPVILDCCNIDANNPFIMQWSIFAIRNLCENNPESQEVIAGLREQGKVSSSVLEEFGITVHGDGDNQLKIVPLDSLKR